MQGSCTDNDCNYTVSYYELRNWEVIDHNDPECAGTAIDLASFGYNGEFGLNDSLQALGKPDYGLYCAYKSSSVNLSFEKPNINRTPTVTETWNDGCGFYEAQVQ